MSDDLYDVGASFGDWEVDREAHDLDYAEHREDAERERHDRLSDYGGQDGMPAPKEATP